MGPTKRNPARRSRGGDRADVGRSTTMTESTRVLVTVVIPVYNRASLIGGALDSVGAQSWRPLEVVVVDDGSTDGTADAVADWRATAAPDFGVRVIAQPNLGGNAARNRGAVEARGSVLAFLDSDDRWHPDKLMRQIEALEAHPDHVAVYCGLREVDLASGRVLSDSPRAYPAGDLRAQLLVRDVTAPTSTCAVREDAFHAAGGFDTDLAARQDWDMWIRLATEGPIAAVPAALVDLGHHEGPRTITDPSRELTAHRRILEKYAALRREQGVAVELAARAAFHCRAGRVHLHHMDARGLALGHYLRAILLWPVAVDSYAALLGWFLPGNLRRRLHQGWNRVFGRTPLAIRSH